MCCQNVIFAESSEPQPSVVPTRGNYEDHRRQMQERKKTEEAGHLITVYAGARCVTLFIV